MSKLSCDIQDIYRASTGHTFILRFPGEVTNYLMIISSYRGTSHEIGEALIHHVFCKHGFLSYLLFDEDQAFLSSIMQYIYKRLGIKIDTKGQYNNGSLQTKAYQDHP